MHFFDLWVNSMYISIQVMTTSISYIILICLSKLTMIQIKVNQYRKIRMLRVIFRSYYRFYVDIN